MAESFLTKYIEAASSGPAFEHQSKYYVYSSTYKSVTFQFSFPSTVSTLLFYPYYNIIISRYYKDDEMDWPFSPVSTSYVNGAVICRTPYIFQNDTLENGTNDVFFSTNKIETTYSKYTWSFGVTPFTCTFNNGSVIFSASWTSIWLTASTSVDGYSCTAHYNGSIYEGRNNCVCIAY